MSKSKKNGVPPAQIVDRHGTDTERLYTLFMGPVERDIEWTEHGVRGAHRFLNRVWAFIEEHGGLLGGISHPVDPAVLRPRDLELWRIVNQDIREVTQDFEAFRFNTAISILMTLMNRLSAYVRGEAAGATPDGPLLRWAVEMMVLMLSPIAPFISEELWRVLGHDTAVLEESWPVPDEGLRPDTDVTVIIQVNGRVRGRIILPLTDAHNDAQLPVVARRAVEGYLGGRTPERTVIVPGRLVNFVVP